ncbi:MAG: sulfatase-like hydrolase/transferase [Bacteroidales bacterium]|nr:sulfatase-like hydrolase/transferase [Lentimicrobiaceae bacterium]MDD5694723.1 sulfatase-like hydrolase/transferase [Bacteroidales bacterium]
MKRILYNLLMQFVFWLVVFAVGKAVFMIYNAGLIVEENAGFWHVLAAFWHALPLDMATTCYLMFVPFLILVVQSFYSPAWLNWIHKGYTLLIVLIYSLIIVAENGIYFEWRTKLPYKALLYLSNPSEIYNTAETKIFFILSVLFLLQVILIYWLYIRFFFKPVIHIRRNLVFTILFFFLTPPVLILGARGGIREIPIMQSQAYYSTHQILNLAATNSFFNLVASARENYRYKGENPFKHYPPDEAQKSVEELYRIEKDTTVDLLTTTRPNIVLILLESWSADLIQALGGDPGITPAFDSLQHDGILFTRIYASGTRSEQGMACLFGGFPAHPISSIAVQPDKYNKLPSLPRRLMEQGYSTSFYFGGQLIYGNIKSYIYYNGFQRIKEIYDFNPAFPRAKLGIHDEFTLKEQLEDLAVEKTPFFSSLFTLSTHSPFDMPMVVKKDWGYSQVINDYLNSAFYTDHCLGDYFREARRQPWYDSTLFILIADHSHFSQKNWYYHSPEYHRIPMLFYGDVIKEEYRGTKIDRIGSQVDLASMLLSQLHIDDTDFFWSKNLLNPFVQEFAYVSFEEGIGWIVPEGHFFWVNNLNTYYNNDLRSDAGRINRQGRSFLQVVYQNYLDF